MSVRERLEDVVLLWQCGRKHGAWIQALIAAAATSRQRFPSMSDGDAFRAFICEISPTIMDGISPPIPGGISYIFESECGKEMHLDQVFYKQLRCNLLHEALIAPEVCFSDSQGGKRAGIRVGPPLTLPDYWVLHLSKAVATAPENSASCAGLFS